MITIQELHRYKKLSDLGLVPALSCAIDSLHLEVFPWTDEEDKVCLWCVFCDSRVYLGSNTEEKIMALLDR
jgi:hypothetical protein